MNIIISCEKAFLSEFAGNYTLHVARIRNYDGIYAREFSPILTIYANGYVRDHLTERAYYTHISNFDPYEYAMNEYKKYSGIKPTRKYWLDTFANFDNVYNVIYTETVQQENKALYNGYERITRKDAMRLCSKRNNGQLKSITNI